MRLVLIGFMGSGKTTAAELSAKELGWAVKELDHFIVARSGRNSVNEIFELDGESRFRQLELEICKECAKDSSVVISTGGGVIENPESIANLKTPPALTCYLRTSFATISERLHGDLERPLFADKAKAVNLYSKREPVYASVADVIVDTDEKPPQAVVREILSALKKHDSKD